MAAPQPEASKPAVVDAPALDPHRDRDEVAANSAAGGSDGGAGGLEALPLRKLKMLAEAFGAHAPSLGRWA